MTEQTAVLKMERWPSYRRKIPYGTVKTGYIVNPEDPLELIPDPEQIAWIEQAFDYLEGGSSLREVSEWVGQKLKRSVAHQTLSNLYRVHRKPHVRTKTQKRKGVKRTKESIELATAKMKATQALKKANELEAKRAKQAKRLKTEDYDIPPAPKPEKEIKVFEDAPASVNIVFKPNPGPQTWFLMAEEPEVLYGGAAGGGKSYAMLADPMRYFENPNFVGLLLRRTNDELRELKWESQKLYPKAFPGAVWKEKDSMWVFPSGAKFWMTYLERDDDVMRYQGQAFTWIGVDELTQYATPFAWTYLKSRLRTADPTLPLSMRATTNPGGPGHQWVKKMFVDPAVPGQDFWARDINTNEILVYPKGHAKEGQPLFKRRFIPAKLSDNPFLSEDGVYEASLLGLPEDQRRKLLDGDWSVMEGAAFPEFNPTIHVVEPFDIPDGWRKFRSGDFGYSSASAVLWFAIDPEGQLVVYRELYTSKKTGVELAHMVLNAEAGDSISYGILDSSVWHQRGHYGPSIAEEMMAEGCRWRPSDRGQGSRVAGKNRLHELLKVNPSTGKPGLVIFNTCRQLLADLPMIPADPNGGDDIDDRYASDHTYDALRYGIMSRPRPGHILDWGTKPMHKYTPADPIFGY